MPNCQALKPWRCQVAIDLGTAFFRIAAEKFGVVTLPTATAAKPLMHGGVVADQDGVAEVLRPLVHKARRLGLFGPLVLAGIPTDAQAGERKALSAALCKAGAAAVQIVPEPLAAAVGAGLDTSLPFAQMILDIGEGVTDCAVLRNGRVVKTRAARIGCRILRDRVQQGLAGNRDFAREAERLLATVGVAGVTAAGTMAPAPERAQAIQEAIEATVAEILAVPAALLREIPDDIGCEIIESGIVLTGGGALIPGLRERLGAATGIRVTTPQHPLDVVVEGLQEMMPNLASTRSWH